MTIVAPAALPKEPGTQNSVSDTIAPPSGDGIYTDASVRKSQERAKELKGTALYLEPTCRELIARCCSILAMVRSFKACQGNKGNPNSFRKALCFSFAFTSCFSTSTNCRCTTFRSTSSSATAVLT